MSSFAFSPVLLELPSLTPSLALEILPRGLTVHKIFVQVDGKTHDIVIGPENASDFVNPNHNYTNTIVGRYSNRIPVGTHELERNGVKSQFTAQENENARVSLHGGPKGFDKAEWEFIEPSTTTLFSESEKSSMSSIPSSVVFRLISEDGDQGFPGKLLVEVLVGLLNPGQTKTATQKGEYPQGSIVFVYRAKLLSGGAKVVTPVNLTQHWGFNLDASLKEGPSAPTVKDHVLSITASHTIDLDENALSTGKLNPVAGTHHHHSSKLIGEQFPDTGYDEFYILERPPNATVAPTRVPLDSLASLNLLKDIIEPDTSSVASPLVELSSNKSGIKLAFDSNQSGVQFYSGNFIGKDGARKKIHGGTGQVGQGDGYGPGTGAFLEFHEPLAAWLHPLTTPSGNDTILSPDELYHNFVKVDVIYHDQHAL